MITHYRGYTLQDFTAIGGGVQIWWDLGQEGADLIATRPTVEEAKAEIDSYLFAP